MKEQSSLIALYGCGTAQVQCWCKAAARVCHATDMSTGLRSG